jgi:LPS export ABC transporter protein LptC
MMRKIPIVILGGVVLFLLVTGGMLVARSRGARSQAPQPAQSRADYRIKEVHLQEEDRGRGSWQLDADYGEVFENLGKTLMRKVTIRINEPTRTWTVKSDEGELARDSKDVQLKGHVVVVSTDGLRLETDRLTWVAKEQRVWTDDPVTIWRGGMLVRGQGFESRAKEQITTVKGRVRATINGDLAEPVEGGR